MSFIVAAARGKYRLHPGLINPPDQDCQGLISDLSA